MDDIFGIWIPPETEKEATWNEFKKRINQWGTLEWIIQEPSKKTVFLDLNIELRDTKIHNSTFQKALNLYLYIPPTSAQLPERLNLWRDAALLAPKRSSKLRDNPTKIHNTSH
jgi:hypothetical protein